MILGAGGQVGRCVSDLSGFRGIECIPLTRGELDICDLAGLREAVADLAPDVVLNAAACTDVERAERPESRSEVWTVNASGAENVARASADAGAPVIHLSTDYVFDGTGTAPYSEDDTPSPLNVYGMAKLEGDRLVAAANPRHLILRSSWIFSPYSRNFVRTMLRLMGGQREIRVVDDQVGGPTSASDLARTVLLLCCAIRDVHDFGAWGLYNYAGKPDVSWFSFASFIRQTAVSEGLLQEVPDLVPISSREYPSGVRRPPSSRLDLSRIRSVFGLPPSDWQHEIRCHLAAYLGQG